MPELPEVETVKRGLDPLLRGRSITDADIMDGRLTAPEDPVVVSAELIGERFTAVARRGKYLLFGLDAGRTLVVHLRMTGWFHHRTGAGEEPAHVRAVLRLDDGASLVYADQRRFGTWRLIAPGELDAYLRPRAGPEPLSDEWTPRRFRGDLAGRRASVKALLLHQTLVAGVGNIYADEALWQARIHPLRPGGELTAAEVRRLHAAVVESLERGIASQGATISNYRGPDGQPGSMQERFNAYDRDGEPCPRCGTPIEKIRVAQRGTHLCPRCTRPP
jgi:formamidopyrimidine-DNA glycosylase